MTQIQPCRHGTMIFPDNDVYVGRSLAVYGEWSEGEVNLLSQLLRPGDIALDLGANLGALTLPMARAVAPGGGILAFEPQRFLYYFLCGNVALNGLQNVHCHQQAVGAAAGVIAVPDINYSVGNNFGGVGLDQDFGSYPTYRVPLVRIDDIGLPRCRLIKADVEGMELAVLQGAADTIARLRPILYLEDDRPTQSAPLRQFIRDLGYRCLLHSVLLFNPDNFRGHHDNIFPTFHSPSLFCWHADDPCPIDPQAFSMKEV